MTHIFRYSAGFLWERKWNLGASNPFEDCSTGIATDNSPKFHYYSTQTTSRARARPLEAPSKLFVFSSEFCQQNEVLTVHDDHFCSEYLCQVLRPKRTMRSLKWTLFCWLLYCHQRQRWAWVGTRRSTKDCSKSAKRKARLKTAHPKYIYKPTLQSQLGFVVEILVTKSCRFVSYKLFH